MLRETLIDIFSETWPMILIFCLVIMTLRISYVIKNKVKIVLYEEILTLCFIIYVLCLFYVVTFQDVSWSTSNYTFFKEMFRYQFGSRLFFKNVVGTMLMFVPYGFFASYYLKAKKPYFIILLSTFVSIMIEVIQLVIGRVFDVDDILLNIIGGFIGYILYTILMRIEKRLPKFLKNQLFYNIIIIVSLVCMILYLFKIINVGV